MSAPGGTLVAEAAALTPARKRWTLLAVILGSGIVFLDTSVVNLALPRIGEELSSELFGTLEAQSYVANGYFVTLSALLILGGALSDYFGRRRMFAIGLVGFAATSLLCGIAPSMEFLIVCRILQGAAGAVLVPGSLAIITATFQGEEQGRAFGLWAGASAATTIFGPFVGGLLVNTISWRMAFLINLPADRLPRHRRVRAGVARRPGHPTLRLAGVAGGRRRRGRTRLRDDPRPAARLERADRHGELGGRRGRGDRLPVADDPTDGPAGATRLFHPGTSR
jgi:MFS family permease